MLKACGRTSRRGRDRRARVPRACGAAAAL